MAKPTLGSWTNDSLWTGYKSIFICSLDLRARSVFQQIAAYGGTSWIVPFPSKMEHLCSTAKKFVLILRVAAYEKCSMHCTTCLGVVMLSGNRIRIFPYGRLVFSVGSYPTVLQCVSSPSELCLASCANPNPGFGRAIDN